jgi:hypothetical protein
MALFVQLTYSKNKAAAPDYLLRISKSHFNLSGLLESSIVQRFTPPLIVYKRYMDDIFILFNNEDDFIHPFLSFLRTTFDLTITSSSSPCNVTFLDLRIHIYRNHFEVTFHLKNQLPFCQSLLSLVKPQFIGKLQIE